jgi:hypothetical protein
MRIEMTLDHRVMALVLFAGFALLASLADAERPNAAAANESRCDALSDATPGLESLCVNYCDRRDCPNSDKLGCDILLANYDRHRRDGDPEMPCLQTCPCFTARELRDYPAELTQCIQQSSSDTLASGIFGEPDVNGAGAISVFASGFNSCLYADFTVDPRIVRFGGASLDSEVVAVCVAMVDAEIAARGHTCQPL